MTEAPFLDLNKQNPNLAHRPPGMWGRARHPDHQTGALDDDEAQELLALGYFAGQEQAPTKANVTVYDSTAADNGLNLYSSGHAPEAY